MKREIITTLLRSGRRDLGGDVTGGKVRKTQAAVLAQHDGDEPLETHGDDDA